MKARYTFIIDVEHDDYDSLDELIEELTEFRKNHKDIFCLSSLLYDPELLIDIELTSVEEL